MTCSTCKSMAIVKEYYEVSINRLHGREFKQWCKNCLKTESLKNIKFTSQYMPKLTQTNIHEYLENQLMETKQ